MDRLYTRDCDPIYSRDSTDDVLFQRSDRSILSDLKNKPLTEDVKNQADVIFNKMKYQVRRGKIRFQMLFYCTYCAHLELGREVNPLHLGSLFGLSPGEVQRCDSLFSPLQTGYKPPRINASPINYLPEYCRMINLSQDAIDEFVDMSKTIIEKEPSLLQDNPQTVAAGLLRYYTMTNGIVTSCPTAISTITNRSIVTIDSMLKKIAFIDNR